jgi:hypothetical protein
MSLLSAAAGGILLPEEVGPLILQPLRALSTAIRISTEVTTGSSKFRLPVVQYLLTEQRHAFGLVDGLRLDCSVWSGV